MRTTLSLLAPAPLPCWDWNKERGPARGAAAVAVAAGSLPPATSGAPSNAGAALLPLTPPAAAAAAAAAQHAVHDEGVQATQQLLHVGQVNHWSCPFLNLG